MTWRAALVLAVLASAPALAQEPTPPEVVLQEGMRVARLELRAGIPADAAFALLGEATGINFTVTPEAARLELSATVLRDVTARQAVEALCKTHQLWFRRDGTIVRVMTAEEFGRDLTVVREPLTRVFNLRHPNPVTVATTIQALFSPRVNLSYGVVESDSGGLGGGVGGGGLGGGALGGLGGTGAASGGNLGTTGSGLFSDRLGGVNNTVVGGVGVGGFTSGAGFNNGLGTNGGSLRGPDDPAIDADRLTADRLARLAVNGGDQVVGDEHGLVNGRPIIQVNVNRAHNLLVVRTADDEAMDEIERLVIELDRPLPEVLLEVKVLEVRLGDGFQSALDLDWVDDHDPFDPGDAAVNVLSAMGSPAVSGGSLVYQFLNEHVRARIRLLGRESRLATLATPLLLCANGETAQIFIGEERPLVRSFEVQTVATQGVIQSNVVPTVDLRDIGNTLRLIPRINADRSVSLTLVQDISSVNIGGANLPVVNPQTGAVGTFAVDTVNTANLVGTVVAKDGLTIAVGGLIRKAKSDSQEGVPYLQELPLVGWLFGSVVRSEEQSELVLLITPHVISTPIEGEEATRRRLRSLSLHPWHDMGERALQRYDRDDVPGSEGYRLLIDDYLLPIPDPEGD